MIFKSIAEYDKWCENRFPKNPTLGNLNKFARKRGFNNWAEYYKFKENRRKENGLVGPTYFDNESINEDDIKNFINKGYIVTKEKKIHNRKCPRCHNHIDLSILPHHIVPRSYKGPDTKENYIDLCGRCHDYVEIKTDEWIQSGKYYNMDMLRNMIINDGFE